MRDGMFFGTKKVMDWVPNPQRNADRGTSSYSNENQFTNGAISIYRSVAAPRVYEFDWPLRSNADLRHLQAVYQGLYSVEGFNGGEDLVFFLDPFAMNTNVLPAYFAAPALCLYGAPNILGPGAGLPVYEYALGGYGYPVQQLETGQEGANWSPSTAQSLWIPVPDGYTFHFGVHGTNQSSAYVGITPDGGTEVATTLLGVDTPVLTNYSYTPTGNSGVTLKLNGTTGLSMKIAGMVAQVLPNGTAAPTGMFIPGNGHSGCKFSGDLLEVGYSTAFKVNQYYSATLKEVGGWIGQ